MNTSYLFIPYKWGMYQNEGPKRNLKCFISENNERISGSPTFQTHPNFKSPPHSQKKHFILKGNHVGIIWAWCVSTYIYIYTCIDTRNAILIQIACRVTNMVCTIYLGYIEIRKLDKLKVVHDADLMLFATYGRLMFLNAIRCHPNTTLR